MGGITLYRVIIVEDELLVRMGLKNSINWGKFGMQIVADAADGQTAYELYEKLKPDLIITDLNMPVMSGMVLISKIREKDKAIKIVILTCLEEFELARKAVSLGVTDYILKHMMTEDQIDVMLSGIGRELSANKYSRAVYELNEANAEIIKEKRIKDLIINNRYSDEAAAILSKKFDICDKGTKTLLCILRISHYDRVKSPIVRDSVLNMLNDAILYYRKEYILLEDDGYFIVLLGYEQNAGDRAVLNETALILKDIDSSIKRLVDTTASFGLSGLSSDIRQLHDMYLQAMFSLENRFFGGAGVYGAMLPFDRDQAVREKTEEMLKSYEKTTPGTAGLFSEYFSKIRSIAGGSSKTRAEYLDAYGMLIQWVASAAKIPGEGNEKMTHIAVSAIESIQHSNTIDEILRALYVFFTQFSTLFRKKQITSREVKQAVDYIETNFSSDLSLQGVAEYVSLSPNYLSTLFKKEINASFTDYLTEIRIEKAKELLLDTYLKTYEIADSVGYNENAYFCKTFKKVTGKTPSEFRRQWLKRWSEEPDDETVPQQ
jgi:two-component system, response regulator YesN